MLSFITMWLGVGVFILGLRHLGLLNRMSRYVIGVWYVVFGILILILVLKPSGLLGKGGTEKV